MRFHTDLMRSAVSTTSWALAAVAIALFAAPARAQAEDPETVAAKKVEKAQEILAEMAVATPQRVYALGAQLREVAGDDDPVLRVVAEGMKSERSSVVLACAGIVVPDYGTIEPLVALIEQGGEHAPWAAGIIGRLGERKDIKVLRALLTDDTNAATIRRAAARGLLQRHAADEGAVAYLQAALANGPAAVTREAALALGEAGHVGAVKRVLAAIATEPTIDGATARAYLGLDPLRRSVATKRSDLSLLVDEIVKKVQQFYPHDTGPDGKTAVDLTYLRDAAARGMMAFLDPFSSYMTLEQWRKREERMRGNYGGIGAYVNIRPYRGDTGPEPREVLTISQPIYKQWDGKLAPAYRAGLRSGDQVVKCQVPEHPDGPIDLLGKSLPDCIGLLKGPPGTKVVLWVRNRASATLRRVELARATIEIDTAPGGMMPGDVGYVRIIRFDSKTGRKDLANRLRVLREGGAKGLIIDLRGNPGGSLAEVVRCADFFVESGALVTELKGRHENWDDEQYHAKGDRTWAKPVVILTDEDSASGSELLSGALRDHGVAAVIGRVTDDKPTGATFGKGSGQTFLPLQRSVAEVDGKPTITRIVALTVFKYYLPKGDSVHKTGHVPDIAIKLPEFPEWQVEAADALRRREAVAKYADGLIAAAQGDPALKKRLMAAAVFDGFETGVYVGFDEWMASLKTKLDAEALSRMVRGEIRLALEDERAREFLFDFQEDLHLQRGLREVLRRMKVDPAKVAEYRHFAERKFNEFAPRTGETEPTRR